MGRSLNFSRFALRHRGFTILELMVVISIIALATVGVSFAMRDEGNTQLQREGERLAALLDSARAQSRASGTAVRWRTVPGGFAFEGLPTLQSSKEWLSPATYARGQTVVWLGPEPLIGPQQVWLSSESYPDRSVRVVTDGLRPFTVEAAP